MHIVYYNSIHYAYTIYVIFNLVLHVYNIHTSIYIYFINQSSMYTNSSIQLSSLLSTNYSNYIYDIILV